MLMGTYRHSLDDKGRIAVPAKFRADLGERFVVCNGLDGCLFLFSLIRWQNFAEQINSLPIRESTKLSRYFISSAAEVELDGQGRICIPPLLREKAELKGASLVVGAYNRVEIWNMKNWQSTSGQIEQDDIVDLLDKINF